MSTEHADQPATALSPALREIEEVARLRTERDRLAVRHAAAKVDASRAEERVQTASKQLASEKRDVAALETMSLTRVLASLRGRRLSDLERERGEARAAEYTYAVEHARWQECLREEATLVRRLNELGLLDDRWAKALDARAAELDATSPEGVRIAGIAERLGLLAGDRRELLEAEGASQQASAALAAAAQKLSSAAGWATYDTFFGGGLFADLAKHQHLDEASALITTADGALQHLGNELADVGIDAVGGLGISELGRTLDVWFDNIFSDWSVAKKIETARSKVTATQKALASLDATLAQRLEANADEERALRTEREALLSR